MNRLFHTPRARLPAWGALALFAAAYLATVALVLVPGGALHAAPPSAPLQSD